LHILYSHRVQSRDGQSVHIDDLVAAFREQRHEVLVIRPNAYIKADFGGESAFIGLFRRLLPRAFAEFAELLYNFSAFMRLRAAFLKFEPDFVYERYALYHLAGFLLKRLYQVPFYLEVNSPLAEERARYGGLALRWVARKLERLTWRSADRIFAVSGVLAEMIGASGVPAERITVIPNGIDTTAFPSGLYQAQPEAPVTIGFVGFMRDWHGLDRIIAGLAEAANPAITLIVAGDGPARPALERQAESLGVGPLVQFLGTQQRQDIPELIRRFDIALQPRAVSYASPLKLFEYMASGCAIVAPDQPNIREILQDGETALLFDPDEPVALWSCIRRLAAEPGLREALGAAARRTIDARDYTWQGNATRVIAAVATDAARRVASVGASPLPDRSEQHE